VWADQSGGITINYRCDNIRCRSGKGPWDTDPPADIEQRGANWHVRYRGIVVGSHVAKYEARHQANSFNAATGHQATEAGRSLPQ
jgi:hypothetical protein